MTRRAVLICPGRGTYNKEELGYIARHHGYDTELFQAIETIRQANDQPSLASLDGAETFNLKTYSSGDVASPLIASCGLLDAQALQNDIDVVAVTGNSMGWYTALGLGGAVDMLDAYRIVDGMGGVMQRHMSGGQVVVSTVHADWRPDPTHQALLLQIIDDLNTEAGLELYLSIDLGGMLVVAGNDAGLHAFEMAVPERNGFKTLRLPNHAGFHSPMQNASAADGRRLFQADMFRAPTTPMIDGRGVIWWPHSSAPNAMHNYTFGAQVVTPYDFTAAIRTAAREFAPDLFIIVGPGTTLGGAVAQSLIECGWGGLTCKEDFQAMQAKAPRLITMGRADQRGIVI